MKNEPGFIPFKTRWGGMPYASPINDDSGALWYSYNVGGVHVIVLCAYADFSATSPMVIFLKNDLAAVNRSITPWVIAVWHPPWYNTNTKHYLDGDSMRRAIEPMLLAYRVNAVFVGHVHAYQRTHMVANNTVVDPSTGAGIYHFMVGISGKELYQVWRPDNYTWLATRDATFWGTSYLWVPNATHARFTVNCASGDGYACPSTTIDTFWFTNRACASRPCLPTL